MARALLAIALASAALVSAAGACVDTEGLSGGADDAGASGDAADVGAADADASLDARPDAPIEPSCRRLRESGFTTSGVYKLRRPDGGTYDAYCDMETFDGGWTLVTEAMIVEEKRTEDFSPSSAAKTKITRTADPRGGLSIVVEVLADNCGTTTGQSGPRHHVLFDELDAWKQIMASYEFTGAFDCWDLFGAFPITETNLFVFDAAQGDVMDNQTNMGRSASSAVIPFDGRTRYCDTTPDNFWNQAYAAAPKSARVVQRRKIEGAPAGLGASADCTGIFGSWRYKDIFVR